MLRRIGRLALTTAAAVLLTQAPIAVTPAANAAVCNLATIPFAGTYSGSTGTFGPEQWHTTAGAGQTTIDLSASDWYSHLVVYDSNCVEYCRSAFANAHSCTIDTVGTVNVLVANVYNIEMSYTLTATIGMPTVPAACADGIDNDLDGATDYPADDECSGEADDSEGVPGSDVDPTPSCEPGASVPVCVDIDPGALFQTVSVYDVATVPAANATVVGRVDRYRLPLPTGGSALIPCVVLVANSQAANPCAQAGATYVDTTLTLVDESETVSSPGLGSPLPLARICHADYTITVAGHGVDDMSAYAIC